MTMPILLDDANLNPGPKASPDFIVEVNAGNFKNEVLEASRHRLVIVDFWAPWCGPCKQLVPALEKQVLARRGAVRLAKINIDANGPLAAQMRVQTVPTVFAFFQGQPVDGFTGAVAESQLKSWIDRLVTATGSVPPGETDGFQIEEALSHAQGALNDGDLQTAKTIYADILKSAPMEARAFAGSLRCLLAEGKTELAAEILEQAHPDLTKDKLMEPVRAAIEMARQAENKAGQIEKLARQCEENPNDHAARFDLAMAHYANSAPDRAIDSLLEIVRRDRAWNDEAARKQLVKLFDIIGPTDPLTIEARRRLSSILFA